MPAEPPLDPIAQVDALLAAIDAAPKTIGWQARAQARRAGPLVRDARGGPPLDPQGRCAYGASTPRRSRASRQ